MSADAQQEEMQKEREHRLHTNNLGPRAEEEDENTAEILRQLSEIDDLPINPQDDPIMGQLISKLASTANLDAEHIRSNEWVREYIFLLYLCKHPRPDGLTGSRRAWVAGDAAAYREPLSPEKRMEFEALVMNSKLALTRSEDFEGVRESTRTVKESVVRDESKEQQKKGIIGRIRG